jgi:hypothetical protein
MQKPEIDKYYKIELEWGLQSFNILRVVELYDEIATYYTLNDPHSLHEWDFIKYPTHMSYKLTSLELELI